MTTRLITPEDRENAQRLRAIWNAKKQPLELNQTKAAALLGFRHQSTVSQYLNCNIAMNTEIVLKFAQLLEVDPVRIDPSIRDLVVRPLRPQQETLRILCRLELSNIGTHGVAAKQQVEEVANPFQNDIPAGTELVGVEIGSSAWQAAFGLPHRSTAFVLLGAEPDINAIVFAKEPNQAGFYRFNGLQQNEMLLTDPLTGNTRTVPTATIVQFGLVVGFMANDLERRAQWSQLYSKHRSGSAQNDSQS